MNTNINTTSYLKAKTNSELEQIKKDAKILCGPCRYNESSRCTAETCSVIKIIEQVNNEINSRNKI